MKNVNNKIKAFDSSLWESHLLVALFEQKIRFSVSDIWKTSLWKIHKQKISFLKYYYANFSSKRTISISPQKTKNDPSFRLQEAIKFSTLQSILVYRYKSKLVFKRIKSFPLSIREMRANTLPLTQHKSCEKTSTFNGEKKFHE